MAFREELSVLAACCSAAAATVPRLVRPRPADTAFLASLPDVDPPAARVTVEVTPLFHGSQRAPGAVVEGRVRPPLIEIGYVSFLVRHPSALFVIDPSLGADGGRAALAAMPAALRAGLQPSRPVRGLGDALADVGVDAADVEFGLPTHLHWDHVAGLTDLPSLPLRVDDRDHRHVATGTRWGVFADTLLGRATLQPYQLDGPPVLAFTRSRDVFGDGSVVLVDLSGHTPGSVGVLVATGDSTRVLLCGDAVWNVRQIDLVRQRAPLPGRLVDSDRAEAFRTVHRLHAAAARVAVVPSHDAAAVRAVLR